MCAIIGALCVSSADPGEVHRILRHIWEASHERGRDGRGFAMQVYAGQNFEGQPPVQFWRDTVAAGRTPPALPHSDKHVYTFVANLRAEPTTEFVAEKEESDQQPYTRGAWSIVHNGTIANDKELRYPPGHPNRHPSSIDSTAIVELLDQAQLEGVNGGPDVVFENAVGRLKGSFAILAANRAFPRELFFACNYRPIWYINVPGIGAFFASARGYFPEDYADLAQMVPPYTCGSAYVDFGGVITFAFTRSLFNKSPNSALVVCSGGLDSVVAATWAKQTFAKVALLHFQYGSRAQDPEAMAIEDVAVELGITEVIHQPINVYRPSDSPLLQKDSKIAGGEEGAEFAHEWVPARNLLMLSLATAIAEARGFGVIVLGNNLEEAGAYPDNEPEFIARFNDLLPFAVGDGKRIRVAMPVGNLMKHEIVALGIELGAPLHVTWSCYRAGLLHCGKCGPCFMRRTAFKINDIEEVIEYAE